MHNNTLQLQWAASDFHKQQLWDGYKLTDDAFVPPMHYRYPTSLNLSGIILITHDSYLPVCIYFSGYQNLLSFKLL